MALSVRSIGVALRALAVRPVALKLSDFAQQAPSYKACINAMAWGQWAVDPLCACNAKHRHSILSCFFCVRTLSNMLRRCAARLLTSPGSFAPGKVTEVASLRTWAALTVKVRFIPFYLPRYAVQQVAEAKLLYRRKQTKAAVSCMRMHTRPT